MRFRGLAHMSSKGVSAVPSEHDQQNGLFPKLRFPEFRDAGTWTEVPLRKLSSPITKKVGNAILTPVSITAGLGFVSQASKFGRDISGGQYKNYIYLHSGDFAYNKGNSKKFPQGYVCQLKEFPEAAASSAFICFQLNPEHEPAFFQGVFDLNVHGLQLSRYITSGARSDGLLNIRPDDFYSVKIPTPPKIAEQKKIAGCLSSIDALIAAEADKLEALKDHKNGLMQQLFPVPGETTPRLRFPEFQNAGEWEETTIKNVGSFYYGKSAPKWSLEENAPTPCVRYGELYSKFDVVISKTFSRTTIDPATLRFSKGGEILVPRVGEKPDDFGRCCCYLPLKGIAIGEMISVFETDQNPLFYTYYFRHLYRDFARVVEGQNVKNLYYANLEPLSICRPAMPEQERIASFLSSLDALMAGSSEKLKALKAHKTGLMQQLFPVAVEEST